MIVVTGAFGFIASVLIGHLNQLGYNDIVAVDDFSKLEKEKNLVGKKLREKVDRAKLWGWLNTHAKQVEMIIHLGARTDTTEFNYELLNELNLNYSQKVWQECVRHTIPLIYASSAATYGDGSLGYSDDHNIIPSLQPLNPYGESKNNFDKWALLQEDKPFYWIGLKFFNVYGPNEYHKNRMASVVFHAYHQILKTNGMKLFKSHNPNYLDGCQQRDFVYVKDVCNVICWLMENRIQANNGIYNLGTGKAETFLELTQSVFKAMGKVENISFMDTPEDIRDKYQYFTQADMSKLRNAGYHLPFTTLSNGVYDYVQNYLSKDEYL